MDLKRISPDEIVYWTIGFFDVNATLVFTWVVMAILVIGSLLVTWRLSDGPKASRWQTLLEAIVSFMRNEIRNISNQDPGPFLPFIGTIFLFIVTSALLEIFPYAKNPASSLSTAAALAICAFFSVPIYGVARAGARQYLKNYIRPSPFMLPFNILGELSRTIALAFRLFGNMMSGGKVVSILLALIPFILPALFNILGLLIGTIQAYIFAVLTMVYISSGMRTRLSGPDAADAGDESSSEPTAGPAGQKGSPS
jgi:F-type H+-transporting ATPase subunit a